MEPWKEARKNVEQKKIFKVIIADDPPNSAKDIKQIHKAEKTSKRINPK